ncbi:MAG: hypothetical protein U5L03_05170 [Burkholderiaceae bacterium]|nr:hypothetical protein [Burkholderiaceae bacterium]
MPKANAIDSASRDVPITRADQFGAALERAQPGDVIRFAPGIYRFSGRSLAAGRAGRPMPITAPSASQAGGVDHRPGSRPAPHGVRTATIVAAFAVR